ncbi:MAG TPA: endolytic transglycosylase MltG [Ktedonobacterales bacterium]|nr:endolytic transglycosylase MltG [Ktedonobacterales bacterium]
MKRGALVLTLFVALLALACGFGGTTAALWVTQPAAPGASASINFEVRDGDNAAKVADRLQAVGLIRNAQLFKLLAKYRHLDTGIETGTYELTPGMTMDAIIAKLQTGKPDDVAYGIAEGERVLQYPFRLRKLLPKFNSDNFIKIVTTGKFLDGTAVSSQYWYVMPPQPKAAFALEGYLYPDTYRFLKTDDETVVIKRMLDEFGEQLCPGPAGGKPDAYIHDQAQCKAHAVTVGPNKLNLFTALEQKYFVPSVAKNDTEALYDALILGSIAMREIPSLNDAKDIQGITDVYYNRYLHILGKVPSDLGLNLGADPTVQYARDTEAKLGLDGAYWAALDDSGGNIAPTNAYNTYTQEGLPPGPISSPGWDVLKAAAYPNPDGSTKFFYFLNEVCKGNATHYAANADDFEALKAQYLDPAKCPKS